MTKPADNNQDDYYASIKKDSSSTDTKKKSLKIKKPVVKKKAVVVKKKDENEPAEIAPKPKARIIKKAAPAPVKVAAIKPVKKAPVAKKGLEKPEMPKSKVRLVEREHAGKGLLRSVLSGKRDSQKSDAASGSKPLISFGGSTNEFKPLENRPVMKTPEEERRAQRKAQRRSPQRTNNGRPQRTPNNGGGNRTENRNRNENTTATRTANTNSANTNTNRNDGKLRNDSKPIFQRNIGYSDAGRDGTKRLGKKKYRGEEGKKRRIKTNGVDLDDGSFRRVHKTSKKKEKSAEDVKQILVDRSGQEVSIGNVISVKEFSDKIGIPVAKIIAELMKNGMLVNLNAQIDFDTCFLIGEAFEIKIIKEISEEVAVTDLMDGNIEDLLKEDDPESLESRSPIISVMGHVDHGKTSILDYIRESQVASGEAGGITQKIGAYQVEKNGTKITFLDTPGHEAFTIMRARGAKLTDIAIIVVAADEGMKPQTVESINHAKEAGVPIIMAINKMDKPGANIDLVKGQMAEQGLQPEDWGGDTVVVPVSAHTGLGMDTLLEMIVLQSEMLELKANATRPAIATVIESNLDAKQGSTATILINTGTIKKGDHIVCASANGKVRTLKDFNTKNIDSAGPSVPVQITGLSAVVEGGDILQVVSSADIATNRAKEYTLAKNTKSIHSFEGASLNMLMSRLKSGALKQLKIVLKTDSGGSLEALKAALTKLSTNETQVTFIHAAVGDISQSDVMMAGTSQALLIAYNVGVVAQAKSALAQSQIEFINKSVIYHIIEKVEAIVTGMVDLKMEEYELGSATVKAIFYTGKNNEMMIVGLGVDDGKIENKAKIRVIRNDRKAGSGEVANLKKGPLDVIDAEAGEECGINFKGSVKVEEGDTMEFYKMVERKQ